MCSTPPKVHRQRLILTRQKKNGHVFFGSTQTVCRSTESMVRTSQTLCNNIPHPQHNNEMAWIVCYKKIGVARGRLYQRLARTSTRTSAVGNDCGGGGPCSHQEKTRQGREAMVWAVGSTQSPKRRREKTRNHHNKRPENNEEIKHSCCCVS